MPVNYKLKKVSEITSEDSRVSIIGKVIAVSDVSFVLDDDTGKIEVFTESPVEKNKLVRVFCSVVDGNLKADIVQDLERFDLNLFKKVNELYNKLGV